MRGRTDGMGPRAEKFTGLNHKKGPATSTKGNGRAGFLFRSTKLISSTSTDA